jgi:hypothetical protein
VPRGQDICKATDSGGDAGSFKLSWGRVNSSGGQIIQSPMGTHNFDVMMDPLDHSVEVLS